MDASVFKARQELFREMNYPVTRAGVHLLKWRQRLKLGLWEGTMWALLALKRLIDVAASLAAIILLSPLFLVVAILIYLEDPGPIFFTQVRVGLNGKTFPFYKFRSMRVDAEQIKEKLMAQNESGDGVIFKMKNDPRVTRIGRILRRFSIDEMPQFLNVLRGDISVVGPRPPVPKEVAEYTLEDRKRLHVKPGLTCLWQIQGRSEIPFKEQVRLDLQYIHSQSFWKDIVIILKTVPAVLLGKGAY